jgi:hypothetical protein
MTPKEKAKELVEKIMLKMPPEIIPTEFGCDIKLKGYTKNAIQCTLIAVDEVINYLEVDGFSTQINYWREVKQDLEKL